MAVAEARFELPPSTRGGDRRPSIVRPVWRSPRNLADRRLRAQSGPGAGYPRFGWARAEDDQLWTARRGWTNPDGHRQKGGRPESREETPKEGICRREPHRNKIMLQCNNCKHVSARFSTFLPLLFRRPIGRSGPSDRRPLCYRRDTKASLIGRLPRSHAGDRGPARSRRSSRRGGYSEGPRLPSDPVSLKALAYEAHSRLLEMRNYAGFGGAGYFALAMG